MRGNCTIKLLNLSCASNRIVSGMTSLDGLNGYNMQILRAEVGQLLRSPIFHTACTASIDLHKKCATASSFCCCCCCCCCSKTTTSQPGSQACRPTHPGSSSRMQKTFGLAASTTLRSGPKTDFLRSSHCF